MKKILLSLAATLACLVHSLQAAISVGPSGSGTLTFDTTPAATEWSTIGVGTSATNFTDAGTLDAAVIANTTASSITTALPTTGTQPPSQNALARHNTNGFYLQTRPTGNDYLILMATLQNDTGGDLSLLRINYDWDQRNPIPVNESVAGHRVFFSQSGAAGTWTLISELSTFNNNSTAQNLTATISLGTWPSGGTLYVIWADDNGPGGTANPMEGAYTIDNVSFAPGMTGVSITSPTNTQRFAEGLPVTVNASAAMARPITQVEFFANGGSIGIDTTAPYSVTFTPAGQGLYDLQATATDDQANTLSSAIVQIQIVANQPPSITVTNNPMGAVLVGTTVAHTAVVSDTDGTVVTNVDFYLDGVLKVSDATAPYTYQLGDILAGTHNVSAIAVDNLGLSSAAAMISVTATNPTGVTLIVTNGSMWRYLDDGSDQGTAWIDRMFPDGGWAEGQAELGYGDIGDNRPETTLVRRVGDAGTTNATTYFRHHFNVSEPSAFGDLIVRLLRDDGAVVYINGTEVFRSAITNEVLAFNTFTVITVGDDGAVYQVTNADPALLVVGDNVVAVEVHQANMGSSDVSFDLMLWGTGPRLIITRISSTQVEVSWRAPATGFLLEATTSLSSPSWSNVAFTTSGGFNRATVSTSGASRFFRLRKP